MSQCVVASVGRAKPVFDIAKKFSELFGLQKMPLKYFPDKDN